MDTQATALGQESEAAPAAQENPLLGEPAPQETATEETPSPEATASETAETPWYHSVGSDGELFEHENFKGHRETLRETALSEGRLQAQQELAPLMEGSSQEFAKFTQQLRSLYGRLNQAASEATMDEAAVDRLIAAHPDAFEAMNRAVNKGYQEQLGGMAYSNFLTALAQDMNDFQLVGEFSPRLAYAARGMDKKFVPDLRKRIVGAVETEAYERGRKKGLEDARGAQAAAQQVQQATGTGPNLAPGSPAGGRSDKELLADPSTPVSTLMEIRARQRAAGR